MFAVALTRSVLLVLWSENFERGGIIYRLLESRSTELLLAVIACTIVAGWQLSARAGLALFLIGAVSAGLLYWSASPITSAQVVHFSDGTGTLWAILPNFYRTICPGYLCDAGLSLPRDSPFSFSQAP